ncbi:MAG: phosphocholine cytidylyltransferase family protein [Gammaproteobacteria bacterium]|nr:phosphocholine cytidylyltransferase family protein [Gammaproteobacteria bacterium]
MQAIILAAGIGNRLGALGARPKALLEFGGESLIHRHLRILAAHAITQITLCVGYQGEELIGAVNACGISNVSSVRNADYRRGSVVSLWTVRAALNTGDDVILMDADVLYDPAIMTRLIRSAHRNCFLLDRDFIPGDEPVKLCLRADKIVEFRKQLDPGIAYDYCGESVGFFKFDRLGAAALAAQCERYVARDLLDAPYEEALRDLIMTGGVPLGVEDISGLPWLEIDFPEDIERARHEILPRLQNGRV